MLGANTKREDGKFVVWSSLLKMLFVAFASTFFVAIGGYLCAGFFVSSFGPPFSQPLVLVVRMADLLFFVFCLVFSLRRVLHFRQPIFEVSPEGVLDRASALGAGFVPWEEVREVEVRWLLAQRVLSVGVRDTRAFLARQSPPKRWLMGLNTRIVGLPINVPLSALAVRADVLLGEIGRNIRRAKRN